MIARRALALALLCLALTPAGASAFGFQPDALAMKFENKDGTLTTQASAHPYAFSLFFALKTEGGVTEGGAMRNLIIDLPPGLVANPQAVEPCSRQDFEAGTCEPSSQVGVFTGILPGVGEANGPLYNLIPPPGVAAQVGFSNLGFTLLGSAGVRTEEGYGARVSANNLPLELSSGSATIWGNPSDKSHDPERGEAEKGTLGSPYSGPLVPFVTLPANCESPPELILRAESKFGERSEATAPLTDKGGNPQVLTGCDAVPFEPEVSVLPTTSAAESAAGLAFRLGLGNKGLFNPKDGAVSETEPETMIVTLPEGVIPNAATVNGQGVCTPAQYKAASEVSGPNQGCPQSAKVGTLSALTPLLKEAVEGSVYLAAPHDNPFDSLLALYIVAAVPQRGVLIKQVGEAALDPQSGQLTTIVEGLPPVPYSEFELRLREGPRAPLVTPQLCGTYTSTAFLYPFSDPFTPVALSSPFKVTTGTGGAACATQLAQLPNAPTLSAGTTIPIGGTYSPFVLKISRPDGQQYMSSVETTLPAGLSGKLAGIPYCPEAQIAAAAARSGEEEGKLEQKQPSCPAASQVGTALASAGAGPAPYFVQGKVYLSGPYKGAPLSLVVITPAIAGPFDLGTVVVRAAAYVNETTGQITAKTDPLPRILHGVPLAVRSVSVQMDRPSFTLNPTSCQKKQIEARVTSTLGSVASLTNPFQVGSCRNLGFSPQLQMSLSGPTKRAGHPAFKAVLTQPGGQANISKLSIALPPTEFLDQAHVSNPCTRPQFAAGNCPPSSVLGKVRAFTPLLDQPLEGPLYFRSNGGERELPDVVADLRGQVHLISVGFVDAIHKKGSEQSRIRTTIATVPDAPVSKVVIQLNSGKKKGLLVNSANICKVPNQAIVKITAHNGKSYDSTPKIKTSCGKKKGKKK